MESTSAHRGEVAARGAPCPVTGGRAGCVHAGRSAQTQDILELKERGVRAARASRADHVARDGLPGPARGSAEAPTGASVQAPPPACAGVVVVGRGVDHRVRADRVGSVEGPRAEPPLENAHPGELELIPERVDSGGH